MQVRTEGDPSGTKVIGMDYLADQIVWVLRLSGWRGREGGQDCAEALAWVTGNASDRQTGGKGLGVSSALDMRNVREYLDFQVEMGQLERPVEYFGARPGGNKLQFD